MRGLEQVTNAAAASAVPGLARVLARVFTGSLLAARGRTEPDTGTGRWTPLSLWWLGRRGTLTLRRLPKPLVSAPVLEGRGDVGRALLAVAGSRAESRWHRRPDQCAVQGSQWRVGQAARAMVT